jgi:hypothetical protein
MFFLATYAVVNIVSAVERLLRSPSFRPTFKIHWAFSLMGALGCTAVMFLIDAFATAFSAVIVLAVYLWLKRRGLRSTWGDVRQGMWQAMIRWGLFNLRAEPEARSWRPHFLVLAGNPEKRWYLIDLANTISHDRGILSVATILPDSAGSTERKNGLAETIRDHLEERNVDALVRVLSAPTPYKGAATLIDAYGLGYMVPNTILLGDGETTEDPIEYAEMIASFYRANRNVVIVRADEERLFGRRRHIDIWWQSMRGNGSLMVTLGHLISSSLSWDDVGLHVRMIVRDHDGAVVARTNLAELISSTRMQAAVDVIVDERPALDVISDTSTAADLAFIGLPRPNDDIEAFADHLRYLINRTRHLPAVAYVLAAEDVEFDRILR